MKILICEDDLMIRKSIVHFLQNENYTVEAYENGADGINAIKNNLPDLIITDLHMPVMDGMEFIENVRDILKLQIPIIVLTLVGEEKTVMKAFENGADDYILKPFEPDDLILRINRIINRVKESKNA